MSMTCSSWISCYFHERSWISSCCYIYLFFFALTCSLLASYKFLPSPFCILLNSLLLAIGTFLFVQILMRCSKPSSSKNDKNGTAPYKLNLSRNNDLRAKKLASFRFNPHVKSRRTFKGMKVRAVVSEENSSSSADGNAVEEDDGSRTSAPAVSSTILGANEDYLGRSLVEEHEQPIVEVDETAALLDEDADDKARPGEHQQETTDPVNVEEKPDFSALSENPAAGGGGDQEEAQNTDENEGEKAHKEKDDGANREKYDSNKFSSIFSTAWTVDAPRKPMNLGDSDQERNRRLENLIANRKARKAMERNETDLDGAEGSEFPDGLPFVNALRRNSREFPYVFDDSIPGSAPSLLNPRKNPFDLPAYDVVDHDDVADKKLEQKDPVPVPVHRELLFTRHQSFSIGAFMQERRPSRFNFFVGEEQKNKMQDSIDADVNRLLQEARASRISFSSESDSISEISQGEEEDGSPFKLNLEKTEQRGRNMKVDTDHVEAVRDDISEASVSSSLVTFPETSTPSEEEKIISATIAHEQVTGGFGEESRDLIGAAGSVAMDVNDQVYRNILHEKPVLDSTLDESEAVNMDDEADQVHQDLVHKELAHVSTFESTREQETSDSCQNSINLVAVDSDTVDVDEQILVGEESIPSPEAEKGSSVDSMLANSDIKNEDEADEVDQHIIVEPVRELVIGSSCKDSMDPIDANKSVVHVSTSPEAESNDSNTSTHEQEIVVDSDKADPVPQNLNHEEPVHVSTSPDAKEDSLKTSSLNQVIGGTSGVSMDSAANAEEPAKVDVSTPTLDQSIAGKGASNDTKESLSPLKAAADENQSVAKETSENDDLDAAGNDDVSRVRKDLGG